jgi:hypothetical protein
MDANRREYLIQGFNLGETEPSRVSAFLPDGEEPKKTGKSGCHKLLSSRSNFLLSSAFIRVHSRLLIRAHLRLRFDEGDVEHFVDSADGKELEALFGFGGYFFQVFLVGFGEENDVDARAQCGETFFF